MSSAIRSSQRPPSATRVETPPSGNKTQSFGPLPQLLAANDFSSFTTTAQRFVSHEYASRSKMERSPALSFLDLPQQVRSSIYARSGLTRVCPIDLTETPRSVRGRRAPYECWHKQRLRGVMSSFDPDQRLCVCPRFPLELALVSRQVCSEVLDVLLGTNLFVVRAR